MVLSWDLSFSMNRKDAKEMEICSFLFSYLVGGFTSPTPPPSTLHPTILRKKGFVKLNYSFVNVAINLAIKTILCQLCELFTN